MTIPTGRGIAPGNGSLVQAVRNATGATPTVAGKPERALFDETLERMAAERPLMVGDRLDTDIDGAIGAGIDSLAVLSGVNSLADVAALPSGRRPTFVGPDLSGSGRRASRGHRRRRRRRAAERPPRRPTATRCDSAEGEPGSLEAVRAVIALAWSTARPFRPLTCAWMGHWGHE